MCENFAILKIHVNTHLSSRILISFKLAIIGQMFSPRIPDVDRRQDNLAKPNVIKAITSIYEASTIPSILVSPVFFFFFFFFLINFKQRRHRVVRVPL